MIAQSEGRATAPVCRKPGHTKAACPQNLER